MIISISNWFHKKAKLKYIFIFLVLLILWFMILPLINYFFPHTAELESLDGLNFYKPDQIYSILDSWGQSGRTIEFWFHLLWDFPMPITSSIFLGLVISWLLKRSFNPDSPFQKLNLVALGCIFDLLENICIMLLIFFYPKEIFIFAQLKIIFTIIKYSFIVPFIVIIIIGIVRSTINKYKIKK